MHWSNGTGHGAVLCVTIRVYFYVHWSNGAGYGLVLCAMVGLAMAWCIDINWQGTVYCCVP